jgi:hypothetical protein
VTETLATALPEIIPNMALATTATFAGPPLKRPARSMARSMNVLPPPVTERRAPKMMNRAMNVAEVPVREP